MKVILLQDVPNVGRKFEIKEVRDGYARNFLLRGGLAKPATEKVIRSLEQERRKAEEARKQEEGRFAELLEKIKDTKIEMEAKVNEKGSLFKKISASDIVKALAAHLFEGVHENDLVISEPIRNKGEHLIQVKREKLEGSFTLVVKEKNK